MAQGRNFAASIMVCLGAMVLAGQAPPPATFMDLLETLDKAEPLDGAGIQRLTGWKLECGTPSSPGARFDCGGTAEVGGVKVGNVDLRLAQRASFLSLDNLSGDCVEVRELDKRFGEGITRPACTDGVTCIYRSYNRSWGLISAFLGTSFSTQCTTRVIFSPGDHITLITP
jgi:hypothetical protein